jgi:hypothetical protein
MPVSKQNMDDIKMYNLKNVLTIFSEFHAADTLLF